MSLDAFDLSIHCHVAETELRHYLEFHQRVEELWNASDDALQRELSKLLQGRPDLEHDELIESHSWELHCNQIKYPSIHRHAITVAIAAFVEAHLDGLCKSLQEYSGSRIRLKDIAGKGIDRSMTFLSRVAGLDLGALTMLARIKEVRDIRNLLVHAGGQLPEEANNGVFRIIDSSSGLRGSPGGIIQIEAEYINDVCNSCILLFREINDEMGAAIARART